MVRVDNVSRFKNWVAGGIVSANFFTYVPMTLLPYLNIPLLRSEWLANRTLKLCFPSVKKALAAHGLSEVNFLFVSDPVLCGLAEIVHYEWFGFRISDEIGAFLSSPPSMKKLVERAVLQANLVFATSQYLCEELEQLRTDVIYLPNGCDYEHFSTLCPEPYAYKNIPRPRAIYVGAIADWFDVDLVSWTSARLSDISFVLIGPVSCNLKDLKTRRNVYVLGPRPYSEVPAYMQHADVGLIPFKKARLTDRVSPIKLFEYCAAGLPVVINDLLETNRYANQEFILRAETHEEFAMLIKIAIARRDKVQDKCRTFAHKNSWAERFATIMSFLEKERR